MDVTKYSDLIRELTQLLGETDLSEIEIAEGDCRIRVVRKLTHEQTVNVSTPTHQTTITNKDQDGPEASSDPKDNSNAVLSPMVGTAYLAPEPGAPKFVSVGKTVREGDTLLIVEAMKVMNQIPAPRSGTIREIFVSDAQAIEFGEPLVVIT